jgi:hypothetical protein
MSVKSEVATILCGRSKFPSGLKRGRSMHYIMQELRASAQMYLTVYLAGGKAVHRLKAASLPLFALRAYDLTRQAPPAEISKWGRLKVNMLVPTVCGHFVAQ